jgi:hypothetical protein
MIRTEVVCASTDCFFQSQWDGVLSNQKRFSLLCFSNPRSKMSQVQHFMGSCIVHLILFKSCSSFIFWFPCLTGDIDNKWSMLKTPCTQQVSNYVLCFLLWVQVRLDLPINLPNWLINRATQEISVHFYTLYFCVQLFIHSHAVAYSIKSDWWNALYNILAT